MYITLIIIQVSDAKKEESAKEESTKEESAKEEEEEEEEEHKDGPDSGVEGEAGEEEEGGGEGEGKVGGFAADTQINFHDIPLYSELKSISIIVITCRYVFKDSWRPCFGKHCLLHIYIYIYIYTLMDLYAAICINLCSCSNQKAFPSLHTC